MSENDSSQKRDIDRVRDELDLHDGQPGVQAEIIRQARRAGVINNYGMTTLRRERGLPSSKGGRQPWGNKDEVRHELEREPDHRRWGAMINQALKDHRIGHESMTALREEFGLRTGRRGRPRKKR